MDGSRAISVSTHDCVKPTNPNMRWLNELEQTPNRRTQFRLEGTDRISWRQEMIRIAWTYLAWQARNASLKKRLEEERVLSEEADQSRMWFEMTSRVAPPRDEDWSKLRSAAEGLLDALLPFRRLLPDERSYVPDEWWTKYGKEGEYQQIVKQLVKHADAHEVKWLSMVNLFIRPRNLRYGSCLHPLTEPEQGI